MLDPALLAAIHDLELVARVTVEGALSGLHRSPFHGYSAEFSQYRRYRSGDDLKYVDWKLFARSDRLYTKQFRETTNVRMQLVLDASASMAYQGRTGASKLACAKLMAGALAHLVAAQGDAPGLTVYAGERLTFLGCRPGRTHLRALLTTLSATSAGGGTASAAPLRRAVDLLRTRGVLILISDLYDDEDGVHDELRRAARIGHDVTVIHVLAGDELDWPWRTDLEVEDSETGVRVLAPASAVAQYRRRMEQFVDRWKGRCTAAGIGYVLARSDSPPDHTLREYLLRRERPGSHAPQTTAAAGARRLEERR